MIKSLTRRLNIVADRFKPISRTVITLDDTSNAAKRVMIIPNKVSLDEWEAVSIEHHEKVMK